MSFTERQVQQLLRPINKRRVLADGKGHSHVSQQDVLAHLIRVFGFGNFDIDVLDVSMVFEDERADDKGVATGRWDICYRAMVRLTVKDPAGKVVCHYENGSTATAQNQKRGDGHDLAYKSAISLSVKRAAIALGDGYGLSLYNKGQTEALVVDTLVRPDVEADSEEKDLQDEVPQQVALGNDEVDHDLDQPAASPLRDKVMVASRPFFTSKPDFEADFQAETGEPFVGASDGALSRYLSHLNTRTSAVTP